MSCCQHCSLENALIKKNTKKLWPGFSPPLALMWKMWKIQRIYFCWLHQLKIKYEKNKNISDFGSSNVEAYHWSSEAMEGGFQQWRLGQNRFALCSCFGRWSPHEACCRRSCRICRQRPILRVRALSIHLERIWLEWCSRRYYFH